MLQKMDNANPKLAYGIEPFYRKISDAENAVWGNIQYQTFTNIIGQKDTDKMWKDHHSSQYRNQRWLPYMIKYSL